MKSKYNRLIIFSVVFFLMVQTSYFWERWIDVLAVFVLPIL